MGLSRFFHGVFNFFKELGHANSWEKSVSATLRIMAPLTEEIVTLAAGEPAAAEVQSVVDELQNDMALVSGIVTSAGGHSGIDSSLSDSVTKSLNAVKENLSGLLAAGHIKDPCKVQKLEGITKTIIGEVDAIISTIPAAATPKAG